MTRENVLFAVVGLLAGYVLAFHLVVYFNQQEPPAGAARAGVEGAVPTNEVKERQRLQTAAEAAARAAREDAQNFDAQAGAAQASLDAQDYEGAIDFLTRANQLRPGDYDTLVKLGQANSAARRFDVAERWFRAALAKRPDDGDVRTGLAATYYYRTPPQPEKAMAVLRETLARDPGHAPSLNGLAFMLIEAGKLDEAEQTIDRLERADPSFPQLPDLRDELRQARAGGSNGNAPKSPTD